MMIVKPVSFKPEDYIMICIGYDTPTNFRDGIPVPYDREQFMAEFVGDPMSSNYIIFLGNVNNCHWFSVVIDNINRQVPTDTYS